MQEYETLGFIHYHTCAGQGRVDELALPRPGRHAADHLPVHYWASGEPGPDDLSSGHF